MQRGRWRMVATAGLGFVLWLAAMFLGYFGDTAAQLVAFGASTVVPLGLAACANPSLPPSSTGRFAYALVALGSPLALGSFLFPRGSTAHAFAAAWLCAALAVAASGLVRIARRGPWPIEELAIDMGHLYLPVGAVWMAASRAGHELLGFREPVVTFTAAHFHFAGFAAPVVAGLMGRSLGLRRHPHDVGDEPAGRFWRTLAKASIGVVICGIPLVAAGIQLSHTIEGPAAVLLGLGMLGCGACLLRVGGVLLLGGGVRRRIAGALSCASGLVLVLSMSFAVVFALTGSATRGAEAPLVSFTTMVRYHGVLNAFGFALLALGAFALCEPQPRLAQPAVLWPKLRGRGFIGTDFFERLSAVDEQRTVSGQLASLDELKSERFAASDVHPAVRRFYEHTSRYDLVVTPQWQPGFRLAGKLNAWIARHWLGNLELPTKSEHDEAISTRLFGVLEAFDGRPGACGYVRAYGRGEAARANYVASYATVDVGGRRHLAAAFPLPFACLVGVLRFDPAAAGGLIVRSSPQEGFGPAGEGLFLVTAFGPLRLPLNERIHVWVEGNEAKLCAVHEVFVFGVRAFRLEYAISERDANG